MSATWDSATAELMIQIVARDVAEGVEMARCIGYKMPKDYQVGLTRILPVEPTKLGERTTLRIRFDDVTYDSHVLLPYLNGLVLLSKIDEIWQEAFERFRNDACTIAHVWIDKHPEALIVDAEKSLRLLDELARDDVRAIKWRQIARQRAQHATYTRGR